MTFCSKVSISSSRVVRFQPAVAAAAAAGSHYRRRVRACAFGKSMPSDRLYVKEHDWVKVDGDNAVIGVTDMAQVRTNSKYVRPVHHMHACIDLSTVNQNCT